jgi:cathepsin L
MLSENGIQGLWNAFKIDHNKHYSPHEEPHRLAVFKANVETIYRHNAENAAEQGWTMGINEYSDMSSDEFSVMLGFRAEDKPQGEVVHLNETDVPNDVDWTTKGVVNPIKNQGNCGSCWAFGTVASVESANKLFGNKKLVSLSEQQLVSCDKIDHGCQGGLPDNAFKYVESTGLTTESSYPYTSGGALSGSSSRTLLGGGSCNTAKITGDLVKVKGFKDVKGESQLAAAVAQQPVAVGIDGKSIQHYKSGIFSGSCTGQIDHAVVVVGYSSDYWKVRNSWGMTFGEQGYIRIAKGSDKCHIADMASYPTM